MNAIKEKLEAMPETEDVQPTPTLGFNRVIERAILHALSAEARTVAEIIKQLKTRIG